VLKLLIDVEASLPSSVMDMSFPGRKYVPFSGLLGCIHHSPLRITFPIVLDDSWNKEALARYMKSTRDKAVYLPSNVEYLAKNNGLGETKDALKKLVESDWVCRSSVLAVQW
jgi:urea carboxylase